MTTRVSLIANDAVTGAGISNETITNDDIAPGTISTNKINFTTALVPVGGIIMWSGTTTPDGWQLCNGTDLPSTSPLRPNITKTPDLRDRFIVGATSGGDGDYPGVGVNQTGGSANAVVVSHNHTGTTDNESATHTHGYSYANGGNNGYELEQKGGSDGSRLETYNGTTGTQSANHTHNFTTSDAKNGSDVVIGASATNANLPPYYALAFIIRVL
jgi:microcystin-dependent protein